MAPTQVHHRKLPRVALTPNSAAVILVLVATACSEGGNGSDETAGSEGGNDSDETAGSEGGNDSDETAGSGAASGMVVEPFDPGCSEEVCHIVLRLNASTLEVLGYSVRGAARATMNPEGARDVGQEVMDANLAFPADVGVVGPNGGMYTVSATPSDFGGFVLVGEDSGVSVAAGGIVWAGQGEYWMPSEWLPSSDVELGSEAVMFGGETGHQGTCDGVASSEDAMDTALRSNLALHLAETGDFSSFSYLYAPSVGALTDDGCEPSRAEYLVVLTQVQ